jgi:hypothetical protein
VKLSNIVRIGISIVAFALYGCNDPGTNSTQTVAVAGASQAVLNGLASPDVTIGKDNDLFINKTTGDLFQKSSGTWTQIGNVGVGGKLLDGAGVPAPELGIDLSLYLDTTTGTFYKKILGVWGVEYVSPALDLSSKVDRTQYDADALVTQGLIAAKADGTTTLAALATKVNQTQYATDLTTTQTAINAKADAASTSIALSTKADAGATQTALNSKVDQTAYNTDKTATASQITANQTATTTALGTKVDQTTYTADKAATQTTIAAKADGATTTAALSSKLNVSGGNMSGDLGLHQKSASAEALDASAFGIADKAKIWYNTATDRVKYWTGAALQQVANSADLVAKVDVTQYNSDQSVLQNTVTTNQTATNTALATKADASATTAALASKVNTAAYSTDLASTQASIATKADAVATTTALATKADAAATTTALATKADAAATTTALATKADAAATTTALATKADAAATTTALATKADASTTTAALATKADAAATTSALGGKLNVSGGNLSGDLGFVQRVTDLTNYITADQGKTWFNSTLGKLKFWNGTEAKEVATEDEIAGVTASTSTLSTQLQSKVDQAQYSSDQSGVQSQISGLSSGKVDKTQYSADQTTLQTQLTTGFASKVGTAQYSSDLSSTQASLAAKADAVATSAALATKVDQTGYNTDKANLQGQITTNLNSSNTGLSGKVDKTQYATDQTANTAALALKSDTSSLGTLAQKSQISDSDVAASGISGAKINGNISGNSNSITGSITESQVVNLTTDLAAKLNSAGGLMTGDIGLAKKSSDTTGYNDTTDIGKTWYNTAINKIKFWAGSVLGSREVATKDEFTGTLAYQTTVSGNQVVGGISGTASSITGTVLGSQVSGNIPGNASGITGSVSGSQVSGNITGSAGGVTGSVAGSQISGNIPGNAAGLTGTIAGSQITGPIAGSQITGNITGNAASVTGSVPGSQVTGAIAGNAGGLTNPLPSNQVNDSAGRFMGTSGSNSVTTAMSVNLGTSGSITVNGNSLTNQFVVDSNGNSGFGIAAGSTKSTVDVQGTINSRTVNNPGATAIDWSKGNLQTTDVTPQALTFNNMVDGGAFTLICTNTAGGGGTGQYTFAGTISSVAATFKFNPANASVTTSSATIYTFLVTGTTVYVSWTSGF